MMRDCTKIVFVLDRSGSMASVKDAMEEVMNGYIATQRAEPGECLFSLYQFDDSYDKVVENVPIHVVGKLELKPRGGTALLDAIGQTIDNVGTELSVLPEHARPNKVMIVVLTDGLENASVKYIGRAGSKASRINEMVKHQREKYGWAFVFLGADQDAIATAAGMGFDPGAALNFGSNTAGVKGAGNKLRKMSSGYRSSESAAAGNLQLCSVARETKNAVTEDDAKEWDEAMAQLDPKNNVPVKP
jgi:hypothetical protein